MHPSDLSLWITASGTPALISDAPSGPRCCLLAPIPAVNTLCGSPGVTSVTPTGL